MLYSIDLVQCMKMLINGFIANIHGTWLGKT